MFTFMTITVGIVYLSLSALIWVVIIAIVVGLVGRLFEKKKTTNSEKSPLESQMLYIKNPKDMP